MCAKPFTEQEFHPKDWLEKQQKRDLQPWFQSSVKFWMKRSTRVDRRCEIFVKLTVSWAIFNIASMFMDAKVYPA